MNKQLKEILDSCLEEVKRGKSIEDCLKPYPQHANKLESLLRMAVMVEEMPKAEPSKEAVDVMLLRMGEALAEESGRKRVFGGVFRQPFFSRPVLVKALATVLVTVIAVWSMGMVSSRSIPGELLYPIKTSSEKLKFVLTRSAEGKVGLRLEFADRRLEEVIKVIDKRGYLSEAALHALLKETEHALDEAQPMDKEEFNLFLSRLHNFNSYTEDVLEQMKLRLAEDECRIVDEAISICQHRSRCMKEMRRHRGEKGKRKSWNSGCRWK